MNIQLKSYQTSDKPFLWTTYKNAMKNHIDKIWGWNESWQRDDFENILNQHDTYIIVDQKDAIGYIQTKNQTDSLFINMIILLPDYRSKGIGKEIIDKILKTGPQTSLKLKCFSINEAAYRFYLDNGFKVTDRDEQFIYMSLGTE